MFLISIPKLCNSFKIIQAWFKLLEQLQYWTWEVELVSIWINKNAVCLRSCTWKDVCVSYRSGGVRSVANDAGQRCSSCCKRASKRRWLEYVWHRLADRWLQRSSRKCWINVFKDFFKSWKVGQMQEKKMATAFGFPCQVESKDLTLTVRGHWSSHKGKPGWHECIESVVESR